MRITALVKSREHVCCRYRIAAYRPHLERDGCESLAIRPWSSAWFCQRMIASLVQPADDDSVLIVQRKLFPAWQLRILRGQFRRLIYDFDDSIFLRSSYNPRGQHCPKRIEQFRLMLRNADAVIAGNQFLRDQAAEFTESEKVHLIPTCIDASRYPLARHDPNRPVVKLAWIGSSSTIRGLEKIRSLLERLGRSVPNVRLKVICDRSLQLDGLPVEFRHWEEASESAELADADIGINWLPDDGWSAGKCGLKVLQYMAAGLPVISNPVGVQRDLVRHGETGFLAKTLEDWQESVRRLAEDAELRRRMGRAGRRIVEDEYGVEEGAAKWRRVLELMDSTTHVSRAERS